MKTPRQRNGGKHPWGKPSGRDVDDAQEGSPAGGQNSRTNPSYRTYPCRMVPANKQEEGRRPDVWKSVIKLAEGPYTPKRVNYR